MLRIFYHAKPLPTKEESTLESDIHENLPADCVEFSSGYQHENESDEDTHSDFSFDTDENASEADFSSDEEDLLPPKDTPRRFCSLM